MAVPRSRVSNARKNSRRAHMAKKPKILIKCPNCSNPILSHRLCIACGHYANREILNAEAEK